MDLTQFDNPQIQEMHKCLLGILKAIHKVCQEHGLTYYLIAGTMLGAVRHKGFVPWDDDADVALPRRDYDILLAHANEWLPERYELVSSGNPKEYPYVFARIQDKETTYCMKRSFTYVGGMPVDIFPLDGMIEDGLRRKWHYFRYRFYWKMIYFTMTDPYKHGRGMRSRLTLLLRKIISPLTLHRKIDQLRKELDYDKCSLVADHDNRPERGICPKEVYGTPVPVSFEGETLMGVAQPDAYLKMCYGNYMELPKEVPPLNYRVLDLHKPYREYVKEQQAKG